MQEHNDGPKVVYSNVQEIDISPDGIIRIRFLDDRKTISGDRTKEEVAHVVMSSPVAAGLAQIIQQIQNPDTHGLTKN